MMNTYSKNMAVLKAQNPSLAKRIEDCQISHFRIEETKGRLNILDLDTNTYLYPLKKIDENIRYDFKRLSVQGAKLAIFLGFGLGYEYNIFIQDYLKQKKTHLILIIEESIEIFKLCLQYCDMTSILQNPNAKLWVGEEPNGYYAQVHAFFIQKNAHYYAKSMAFFYRQDYIQRSGSYYPQSIKVIQDAMSNSLLRFGDSAEDSLIGERNMFKNLSHIIKNPGIRMLQDKFQKVPAVVISTGPSLNKNKHLLKTIQDKALFICPDASLRILSQMDVKPQMITSLERIYETVKLLSGFSEEYVENIYFAAAPVIMPETYEAYPGPKITVYRNFDHFKWLELDKGMLDIQLSAGNMAFKIAHYMGCDPIILIGQDLAFSREGKTHAQGADLGENQEYTDPSYKDKIWVRGNDGKDIQTIGVWHRFLRAYETDLAQYPGLCINATEGGAFIEGTQVMDFQSAIDAHIKGRMPISFAEQIRAHFKDFTPDTIQRDYQHILRKIKFALGHLKAIMAEYGEIKDGIEAISESISAGIEGTYTKKDAQKILQLDQKRVHKEDYVVKNYRETLQLLVMHVIQAHYIQYQNDLYFIDSSMEEEVKKKSSFLMRAKDYFTQVIGLIQIIYDMILEEQQELIQNAKEFEGA